MSAMERYTAEAYQLGKDAAESAASWATDGNDTDESRRAKLAVVTGEDYRAENLLPPMPDLSGEWADGPTPASLARDITGEDDPDNYTVDTIADAFEAGVSDHFYPAIEAELRKWVD